MLNFKKIVRCLYDYESYEEGELSFKEDDILYILDDSDSEWWKAITELNVEETAQNSGLIPFNYIEEVDYISTAIAVYDYEAQTEEELNFLTDDTLYIYQKDDPDWYLANFNGEFGFIPSNYVEETAEEAVEDLPSQYEPEMAQTVVQNFQDILPSEDNTSISKQAQPQASTQTQKKANANDMMYWKVSEIDRSNKKKKKGKLGISSETLFFASEEDKTPVRHWPIETLKSFTCLGKRITLELTGSNSTNLHLSCTDKKQSSQIANKLKACSSAEMIEDPEKDKSSWMGIFSSKPTKSAKAPPSSSSSSSNKKTISRVKSIEDTLSSQQFRENGNSPHIPAKTLTEAYESVPLPPLPKEELDHRPKLQESEKSNGQLALVLYDFVAQADDELTVQSGEQIYVVNNTDDSDWFKCRVLYDDNTFKEGLVPSNYLEIHEGGQNLPISPEPIETPEPAAPLKSTQHQEEDEEEGFGEVREWTDASGSYRVEAKFIGFQNGKIHLHKTNGVKIAVPLEKMSEQDVQIVSNYVGEDLTPTLQKSKDETKKLSEWSKFLKGFGIDDEHRKSYSKELVEKNIDTGLIAHLNKDELIELGFLEGDALRILKANSKKSTQKQEAPKEEPRKVPKPKRSVTFGENTTHEVENYIDDDEKLARQLQHEEAERIRTGGGDSDTKLYQIQQDEMLARKLQNEGDQTTKWSLFDKGQSDQPKNYGLSLTPGATKGSKSTVDMKSLVSARELLEEENRKAQEANRQIKAKNDLDMTNWNSFDDDDDKALSDLKPSSSSDPWRNASTSSAPSTSKSSSQTSVKPIFSNKGATSKSSRTPFEDDWGLVSRNFAKPGVVNPPPVPTSETKPDTTNTPSANTFLTNQSNPKPAPQQPIMPAQPVQPVQPVQPIQPIIPSQPAAPQPIHDNLSALSNPLIPVPNPFIKSNSFVPTRRAAPTPAPAPAAPAPVAAPIPVSSSLFGTANQTTPNTSVMSNVSNANNQASNTSWSNMSATQNAQNTSNISNTNPSNNLSWASMNAPSNNQNTSFSSVNQQPASNNALVLGNSLPALSQTQTSAPQASSLGWSNTMTSASSNLGANNTLSSMASTPNTSMNQSTSNWAGNTSMASQTYKSTTTTTYSSSYTPNNNAMNTSSMSANSYNSSSNAIGTRSLNTAPNSYGSSNVDPMAGLLPSKSSTTAPKPSTTPSYSSNTAPSALSWSSPSTNNNTSFNSNLNTTSNYGNSSIGNAPSANFNTITSSSANTGYSANTSMNNYGIGNNNLGLNPSNTSNLTSSSLGNVNTGLQSGLNNTSSMNNSSYLNANSSLTNYNTGVGSLTNPPTPNNGLNPSTSFNKYNLNEVSSFSNPVTPSGPLSWSKPSTPQPPNNPPSNLSCSKSKYQQYEY
ncbi:hypothetical protein CONCODRAFT_7435 [Conidiobolus coronatus NRRL 28638]|uniref:Actin cytoskeleton-regulatory complex protein SLA1 n=1 Tax=Conidiobolus coronatus (strain ATCC 28846 / CBS 209.66 / NRRL 28638) TaxID=796925 RepID=A0A137P4U4_CONC2|nr:hypothetical protein CONCODRAFT_7435 [Conidiobolus coronatus NRRL 28638]|eukprot:KXN70042.1 hypothetical protein CONCODRAFT_7435 [Conidiobolus coronatus NRRL 28638]